MGINEIIHRKLLTPDLVYRKALLGANSDDGSGGYGGDDSGDGDGGGFGGDIVVVMAMMEVVVVVDGAVVVMSLVAVVVPVMVMVVVAGSDGSGGGTVVTVLGGKIRHTLGSDMKKHYEGRNPLSLCVPPSPFLQSTKFEYFVLLLGPLQIPNLFGST